MKKVIEFIKNNSSIILGIVIVAFILSCTLLPLFIAISRNLWDIALNNPTAIM